MRTNDELDQRVLEEAVLALKFAAEKQALPLQAVDATWIARVIARRSLLAAVHTGAVVEKVLHEAATAKLKSRADQFSKAWAGAQVSADQQLQRAQRALSAMEDRALAEKLAEEIGVILPKEDDALFEVGS